MLKYFLIVGVAVFFLNAFNYSPSKDPHGGSVVYHEFRDSIAYDSTWTFEPYQNIAYRRVLKQVDTTIIRIHTFHTKGHFGEKHFLPFLTTHKIIYK